MKDIFNHYCAVIDEAIDNYNFFKFHFQDPCSLYNSVELDSDIVLRYGATRGCIIDYNEDYVVKFDIPRDMECGSCDTEMDIYNWAKHSGIERYFAKPTYIGTYSRTIYFYDHSDVLEAIDYQEEDSDEDRFNEDLQEYLYHNPREPHNIEISIPLYAYPRAERYDFPCVDYNSLENFRSSHKSPLVSHSAIVGYTFSQLYGTVEFESVSNFCKEMHINDLHTGNIMSINNQLVFTDYAGFHSEYDDVSEY